jgi:hypothetical protein
LFGLVKNRRMYFTRERLTGYCQGGPCQHIPTGTREASTAADLEKRESKTKAARSGVRTWAAAFPFCTVATFPFSCGYGQVAARRKGDTGAIWLAVGESTCTEGVCSGGGAMATGVGAGAAETVPTTFTRSVDVITLIDVVAVVFCFAFPFMADI